MEELLQAIAASSIEQQVSLLPQALEYEESGIDFLIDSLNDPELEVRAKAYELLQHNQSQKVQQAIAPGLLFNPGDKIFILEKA
jgi:HEAT repeat protein